MAARIPTLDITRFDSTSGTEPVVRVTVEADDAVLMQDTLDRLAAAVRQAAAA